MSVVELREGDHIDVNIMASVMERAMRMIREKMMYFFLDDFYV